MRPRTRCHECAKRHVQCDGLQPSCAQCQAAGVSCIWPSISGDLIFHSENVFAKGTQRRPRGPRKQATTGMSCRANCPPPDTSSIRAAPKPCVGSTRAISALSTTQPSLLASIDQLALSKYFAHVSQQRQIKTAKRVLEIESFLSVYNRELTNPHGRPSLEAAWMAMALIHFGRFEKCEAATTRSSDYYCSALNHTRVAVNEISNSEVPDELVLTAMLLAMYEDRFGGCSHLTSIPNSFQHIHGAAALVVRRVTKAIRTQQNKVLDTLVRQQNIKTCLNQSVRVPETLWNDDKFLESQHSREMTAYLIRAAELQSRRLAATSSTTMQPSGEALRDIFLTARQVDGEVYGLQQRLPSFCRLPRHEWPKHLQNDPLLAGCEVLHEYNNIDEARLWNDSRATRLRMSRVMLSIAGLMRTLHVRDLDAETHLAVRRAEETISISAEDVFSTIPYFFGNTCEPASNALANSSTAAMDAGKLTFALSSVAMTAPSASRQRQIAVNSLLRVARIHGNIILERLCTSEGPLASTAKERLG